MGYRFAGHNGSNERWIEISPTTCWRQLGLLAEIDSLVAELAAWGDRAPAWPAARQCQALVRRLLARVDTMRVRLDAPLVVATLGGTGTGKSALVNALVGADVTPSGRERPTTRQPALVCRPGLEPSMLGIDPAAVQVVHRDASVLRDLVLLGLSDPDTTEGEASHSTNLGKLRELLPHCDVLLVTTTQQKYRSAASGRRAGRGGARRPAGFRADARGSRHRRPRRLAALVG